jgi:VIT1/CCC1 family predicted Fe2+/Mn2+ transporter
MSRRSVHVEPRGTIATARHYIRDLVYGANDGIITTFAVVAGVAGGDLPTLAVLVVGTANLIADGVSMGAGNLLAIRAHESARAADNLPEQEAYPWKHGLATLLAFVVAGAVPLMPYLTPGDEGQRFYWSIVLTMVSLFGVGVARAAVTRERLWKGGLEMLVIGGLVALTAYAAGALVAAVAGGLV